MGGAVTTYAHMRELEHELDEAHAEQAAQHRAETEAHDERIAAERRARAKIDVKALRACHARMKRLSKAGALWGAATATPESAKLFREWFLAVNGTRTRGRTLSFRTFKWALQATGDRNPQRIEAAFRVLDEDDDGHVDFEEFAERIPAYYELLQAKPGKPHVFKPPAAKKAHHFVPEHVKAARRKARTLHPWQIAGKSERARSEEEFRTAPPK